jgi:RNA polymerase sigma-70 factor (ECF subfamily)
LLKSATQQPSEPIADDELLLAKARRGDIAAFEQLYRQHLPMVYGLAARLTLDTHLAEDLTQEVFIKVWQRLDRFRGESRFSTWLYRVASNVVLDAMRRKQPIMAVAGDTDVPDTAPQPALQRELEQQLTRLPERARVVLLLHDMVGMTHEEIGEQLDIAPGTSRPSCFAPESCIGSLMMSERDEQVSEAIQFGPMTPARDLWPGIEAQIAPRRRRPWMAPASFAAAGLVALLITMNPPSEQPPSPLQQVAQQMQAQQRAELDGVTRAVQGTGVDQAMEGLLSAEQEIRDAIDAGSDNPALLRMLAHVHHQQLGLINQSMKVKEYI